MPKKKQAPGGAVGKGGVDPAPRAEDCTVRPVAEQLVMVPIDDLVPYPRNAHTHSKEQIAKLRGSLREFGFVAPVIIDFDNNVIAGHGRLEAARAEGMAEVPCVLVSNLTEAQRKAYILADNRLAEDSGWDMDLVKLEMQDLKAMDFDLGLTGWDMEQLREIEVSGYTRSAPGAGEKSADGHFWGEAEGEKTEEYEEFTEKFKPKLTTDDCYTPENIYQCVKDWVVSHYGLNGADVVRPFYPGGDYEAAEYPEGCVVIDNPPFFILSNICRFYLERNIRFFLFAPTLTLFSSAAGGCRYLPVGVAVTYENGASVNTSFVTNLGDCKIETAPDLYAQIKAENDKNERLLHADLPNYVYPPEVVSVSVAKLSKYGQHLRIKAEDAVFIRALDA